MDVATAFFLVVGSIGAGAAALHMIGWLPPRYIRILDAVQERFASKVGVEVENALVRVSEAQTEKMEKAAAQFAAQQAAEAEKGLHSAEMSIVRAVGVDKQMRAKVDSAMAEAILGPAKPILAQFAPGLLEILESNPSFLPMIIEHPLFQKYVAPRIQQLLGNAQGHLNVNESGWGT